MTRKYWNLTSKAWSQKATLFNANQLMLHHNFGVCEIETQTNANKEPLLGAPPLAKDFLYLCILPFVYILCKFGLLSALNNRSSSNSIISDLITVKALNTNPLPPL